VLHGYPVRSGHDGLRPEPLCRGLAKEKHDDDTDGKNRSSYE
jgi:hypothetical protein